MELALIRHGQTDWNLHERVQGRTDIPLNATGREQARSAATRIAEEGHAWDLVLSSPLERARETAEIIAETLGVPLGDVVDDLTEQDFGDAEGLSVAELYARWPDRGFPGAETDQALGERGLRALTGIAESRAEARRVLAVSHGSLIRGTIATTTGHHYRRVPRLGNTSLSLLERRPEWRVLTVGGVPLAEAITAAR